MVQFLTFFGGGEAATGACLMGPLGQEMWMNEWKGQTGRGYSYLIHFENWIQFDFWFEATTTKTSATSDLETLHMPLRVCVSLCVNVARKTCQNVVENLRNEISDKYTRKSLWIVAHVARWNMNCNFLPKIKLLCIHYTLYSIPYTVLAMAFFSSQSAPCKFDNN